MLKNKYIQKILVSLFVVICIAAISCVMYFKSNIKDSPDVNNKVVAVTEQNQTEKLKDISINIADHYITNTGDPGNLYTIDENNVLWGFGNNDWGQLAQGTRDYDVHNEKVKIAENIVHVDYSREGFAIYLTKDNKLYAFGHAGKGTEEFSKRYGYDKTAKLFDNNYYVDTPYLIMEDVRYARCGKFDIIAIKNDGSVWTWGTTYESMTFENYAVSFIKKPEKILDNAVLVTGGIFHAALLNDGTVWTWGYNPADNCGIADSLVVKTPTKVASDVIMVWTGRLQYNSDKYSLAGFDGEYPAEMMNTVIEKMMVHTGFVERVLAQNKKLFREKRSIQLHAAVNLCHMNFLQMNFQNKIWLKVKIPGSYYRGFSVYSATTLANFFLPRLMIRPSPLKSSRVYFVEISVTFSSATETPPCWIFLRPSPLESQSPAFTKTEMISSSPSGKSSAVMVTVGIFALLAPPAKSAWLASLAFVASSSP